MGNGYIKVNEPPCRDILLKFKYVRERVYVPGIGIETLRYGISVHTVRVIGIRRVGSSLLKKRIRNTRSAQHKPTIWPNDSDECARLRTYRIRTTCYITMQ